MTFVLSKLQAYIAMAMAAVLAVALLGAGFFLVKEKMAHAKTTTTLLKERGEWANERRLAAEAYSTALEKLKGEQDSVNVKYQGALNEARKRESIARGDLARLTAESDGLRDQNADAARRIADLATPTAAVREYATAANELLDQCQRRYSEVAGKAQGHADDVATLIAAWPSTVRAKP